MKFTIRALFLVTVIVAVLFGWIVDRQHLWQESQRIQTKAAIDATDSTMKNEKLQRQLEMMGQQLEYDRLPTSQAPTPNPPKP